MLSFRSVSRLLLLMGAGIFTMIEPTAAASATREVSAAQQADHAQAMFAGGCFWCMESPFEQLEGVISVTPGYAGGTTTNPTYETYVAGGHLEVVQVIYDPTRVSYAQLLDTYWRQIDPTDAGGQFADRGSGYLSAIFYASEAERLLAEQSKQKLAASGLFTAPIATKLLPQAPFYPAEEYHRGFHKKNPQRYRQYRLGSGREAFLLKKWPQVDAQVATSAPPAPLRQRLTPLQYQVTQENGTEPPFRNTYWNNKEEGIYVDVVSGEPLFSSTDKFDSGTGWPSFSKALVPERIVEKTDRSVGMERIEVRSKGANSHLGHLFNDGPAPSGQRYCINSAALRFIPKDQLAREGLEQYRPLFDKK